MCDEILIPLYIKFNNIFNSVECKTCWIYQTKASLSIRRRLFKDRKTSSLFDMELYDAVINKIHVSRKLSAREQTEY